MYSLLPAPDPKGAGSYGQVTVLNHTVQADPFFTLKFPLKPLVSQGTKAGHMHTAITLELIDLISILLILILLFLGYNLLSLKWSYKISKPYQWEEAVRQRQVSANLRTLERTYRDKVRFYTFWFQVERLRKQGVPGAFAELGVYQGETANILHEMDPARKLHLFDTFEGFHRADLHSENDEEKYSTTTFSNTSLEMVKDYINGNDNVEFHPGYFPESSAVLKESQYAFVHLDADLYKPTLAALEYFYPKLSPGGLIIIHDYNHNWDGIRKALDEFMPTIPETLLELPDWQGSAMILKNS